MNKILTLIESLLENISKLALSSAAMVTLFVAVLGTLDVVSTNLIACPISGAFEMSEAGLVMLLFFGLAVTSRDGSHIKVDIITSRLPLRGQKICDAMGYFVTTLMFLFWSVQMYSLAAKSVKFRETATGLFQFPLYYVKIAICIALMIATIETFRRFLKASFDACHGTEQRVKEK